MELQLTNVQRRLILFNASLSTFMATLDGSIVNIALPDISKRLHVDISSIQWVVTSYLLTISVLLLIWGKISDIYGRKKIFASGFIIFAIGSALCGLSQTLGMLVISRVVQAVGASAMMALSQGIVTSTFPPDKRGKALGITGTAVALGSLVGPSLGGILVHAAGWESIFYINVPIGIIGMALTFAIIPDIHDEVEDRSFDYKGATTFTLSIVLLFGSLLLVQEGIMNFALFLPVFIIAVVILLLFIYFEKRTNNPLVNLKLFKVHEFSFGLGSAYLSFIATNATLLFIPFYLQYVLNMDTLSSGLLISFFPVTTAVTAPISGWLSDKVSYRPLTVIGLTISTGALIWISTLTSTSTHFKVAVLMALLGLGTAIFQSPNNSSIMGSVPRNQLGVAGGINALFRNLGFVSGTTFSVIIFSSVTKMKIDSVTGSNAVIDIGVFLKGFKYIIIFCAISCFLAAVLSLTRAVRTKSKA